MEGCTAMRGWRRKERLIYKSPKLVAPFYCFVVIRFHSQLPYTGIPHADDYVTMIVSLTNRLKDPFEIIFTMGDGTPYNQVYPNH